MARDKGLQLYCSLQFGRHVNASIAEQTLAGSNLSRLDVGGLSRPCARNVVELHRLARENRRSFS